MLNAKQFDLRAYFMSLVEHCKLTSKVTGNPWYALEAAYKEPPRVYHTINHAIECAMMAEAYQVPPVGVMALLYHDAHYVAGSTINEDESVVILCEHFSDWREELKGKPLPHPAAGSSPLEQISRVIRVTKHDREPDFERGRVDFLKACLAKKQIYYSALLRHRYEKQARENLHRRIHRARLLEMENATRERERNPPCR